MAKKTKATKKKSAVRAPAKKTAKAAPARASAARSEAAAVDPIAAALARRRLAMLSR